MSDPTRGPLRGVATYNPKLLSKEELIDQFVARTALLEQLVSDIERQGASQHHLLIGQRGMGKTTLLRRLGYAIEDHPVLSKRWLPLLFPEEQYNVARLSDLYSNCLDALCDALERGGEEQAVASLDQATGNLPADEAARKDHALSLLRDHARGRGYGLLLLVDNVDLIFERMSQPEQWELRELLAQEAQILLIGASVAAAEATYRYEAPFYEFFRIHELAGLTVQETHALMSRLAEINNTARVKEILEKEPERLRTIHTLSGGNPRTAVLLYTILTNDQDGSIRTDLERLLDQCTPLYKARFEKLAPQTQQVVDALAVRWDPCSAKQIAEHTRLDVKAVSSQLNRLARQGIVQKVEYHPSTKKGFQLTERFFNIWYLMRTSRRSRRRLIWLVEFLGIFFGRSHLRQQANVYLRGITLSGDGSDMSTAEYGLALAESIQDRDMRRALKNKAIQDMGGNPTIWHKAHKLLDLQDKDADLVPIIERHQRLANLSETIRSSTKDWPEDRTERLIFLLLGLPYSLEGKERLVRVICGDSGRYRESAYAYAELLFGLISLLLGGEKTTEHLYRAFKEGYIADLNDTEGARSAANATGDEELALLLFPKGKKIRNLVKQRLDKTKLPFLWALYGSGLSFKDGAHEKGLSHCKKALELSPSYLPARILVAYSLKHHRGSQDEAMEILRLKRDSSPLAKSICFLARLGLFHPVIEEEEIISDIDELLELVERQEDGGGDMAPACRHLIRMLAELKNNNDAHPREDRMALQVRDLWSHLRDHEMSGQVFEVLMATADLALKILMTQLDGQRPAVELVSTFRAVAHTIWKVMNAVRDSVHESSVLTAVIEEAMTHWKQAISRYDMRTRLADETAMEALRLGVLMYEPIGDVERAEKAYRKAVQLDERLIAARLCLAELYAGLPDRGEHALDALEQAIAVDATIPLLWMRKASVLAAMKRHDDALNAYEKALAVDSEKAEYWIEKAIFLQEAMDDHEQALLSYDKAIALEPNDVKHLHRKALLLASTHRYDEAEAAYRKLTSLAPGELRIWYQLARTLYLHRVHLEEAENAARRARELAPSHPLVKHLLAAILGARDQWPEAIALMTECLGALDGRIEWSQIARFFWEAVQKSRARDAIQMLENVGLEQRWRPLWEALVTIDDGDRRRLRRLSPEVRGPTEQLIEQFTAEIPPEVS